ncbi:MAG: TetR/AcrR family transcriptional regulator [Saprospiraceae bacterium]
MNTSAQDKAWIEQIEKLFLRYGVKSVSMDDVATELGISKKTLYQMVESKDELVMRVLTHHVMGRKNECLSMSSTATNAIEEIFIVLDANSRELAQMKANIINDLQKYHRETWLMIQRFHHEFVLSIIRENMIRGRKEGLYREDFDIDIIAKLHLGTAFLLFDEQLFPGGSAQRVVLFKEYMLHFLHGIVSAKGLTYLKKKLSYHV